MNLNEAVLMLILHLRNAFERENSVGVEIKDGNIELGEDFALDDWVAIVGTKRNNGIYKLVEVPPLEMPVTPPALPLYRLSDGAGDKVVAQNGSTATGEIWRLQLPAGFLRAAEEIQAWMNSEAGKVTNVVSINSVGRYAETRAVGADGSPLGWESVFASKISGNWRRMFQSAVVTRLAGG